mmetsp:Transcript_1224/g.3777  ORF Transcript_1224/g.3777 Transcript_1224/m.3777 type:complete len:240 (+) Transcript_1224:617-1336(+)
MVSPTLKQVTVVCRARSRNKLTSSFFSSVVCIFCFSLRKSLFTTSCRGRRLCLSPLLPTLVSPPFALPSGRDILSVAEYAFWTSSFSSALPPTFRSTCTPTLSTSGGPASAFEGYSKSDFSKAVSCLLSSILSKLTSRLRTEPLNELCDDILSSPGLSSILLSSEYFASGFHSSNGLPSLSKLWSRLLSEYLSFRLLSRLSNLFVLSLSSYLLPVLSALLSRLYDPERSRRLSPDLFNS